MEILPSNPECTIVTTRDLNFPRVLVYKAWTDPNHLQNWWGPVGFTNTFHEFDLRPDGKWTFIMHGPDGTDYPNESVYIKIQEPEFLVWNHISKPEFQFQVSFDALSPSTTKVTFKMVFATKEEADVVRTYAVGKNEENFDKLEVELAKMN